MPPRASSTVSISSEASSTLSLNPAISAGDGGPGGAVGWAIPADAARSVVAADWVAAEAGGMGGRSAISEPRAGPFELAAGAAGAAV